MSSFELERPDFDQEGKFPDERGFSLVEFLKRRRVLVLLSLAVFAFLFLIVVSLSIVLPVVFVSDTPLSSNDASSITSYSPRTSENSSRSSHSSRTSQSSEDSSFEEDESSSCTSCEGTGLYFGSRVKNTTESQIDIYQTELWLDREARIEYWLSIANNASQYLDTSIAQVSQVTRRQLLLSAKNCSSSYEFRTRVTIDGDGVGNGYIDVKGNNHKMEKACTLPFEPAAIYQTNSSSKCEFDIHECSDDDKYSRETRIFFKQYFPDFQQCYQLIELYPDAFEKIHHSEEQNTIKVRSDQTWWAKKYTGYLDGDTRYELTFTLRYHTEEDGLNARDPANQIEPASGEWSIRLFSLGEGFTDVWNQDVVEDISSMFYSLMNIVGRPGYCD